MNNSAQSFLDLTSTFSRDGKEFERLCQWILETHPLYKDKLEQVWMWDDWPNKWGRDCGIDLVAKDVNGKIWAIQTKNYSAEYSVTKHDIDAFLSESANEVIGQRLLIATTDKIATNAVNVIGRSQSNIPVSQLMLSDLLDAPISWPKSLSDLDSGGLQQAYTPKPYQRDAIDQVVKNLHSRGQLIMACGTGKTLVALWIAEDLNTQTTLVLLPSLLLLSKTLTEWLTHHKKTFSYLPVCSDETVAKSQDNINLHVSDLAFPVTTDADEIADFIQSSGRKVIFSTYQSSPKIAEAFKSHGLTALDLIIFDEAHRCAGKADSIYSTALDDDLIPSRKRLFTTATPRMYSENTKTQAAENDIEITSMDDEKVFGPVLHKLTFGDAIKEDLLSDYQVVIVGVDNPFYADMVTERRLVKTDNDLESDAESFASHIGLAKAIRDYDLKRVISFHSRVASARDFAKNLPDVIEWMPEQSRPSGKLVTGHVRGNMPTHERNTNLRHLSEVKKNQRYVLSNARCLSEGVDVPALDGVVFIDPKGSKIDIIQAVGRAIRLSKEKEIGTVIIPVFIEDHQDPEDILTSSSFKKIWDVVNALRAHDDDLSEELDELRFEKGRRGKRGKPDKIIFDLPVTITSQFEEAFETKLLEKTTLSWEFWFGLLVAYQEEHGDYLVPATFKTLSGLALGDWVRTQRKNINQLSDERKQRLDSIGFVWDPFEAAWNESFEALKAYQQEHGDCSVPATFKTLSGLALGAWVSTQRKNINQLSDERKQRLDSIGFVWDPFEAAWNESFEALKAYQQEHGDCLVPRGFKTPSGLALGSWMATQRQNINQLSDERKQRLDSIGFVWDVKEAAWNENYEALKAYQQEHGDCLVPATFKTLSGLALGAWVSTQRKNINQLSDERKQRLDSIGFVWDPFEAAWNESFEALKAYQQEHGDCLVQLKFKTPSGLALGNWVSTQRKNINQLSDERKQRLDSIGFVWRVKK